MKNRLFLLGPLIVIILWLIVSLSGLIKPIFIPSPITVIQELGKSVILKGLAIDMLYTFFRFITGYSLGIIFGILIGTLMASSERIYASLEVIVDFFRSIPIAALFPLFLLVFDTGELSKIMTTTWATMLIVLINTMYSVRSVNRTRILVAKTLRLTKLQTFSKIVFPDALPGIFAGLRISLSIALIVVVMTEMFMGTHKGLGLRIINASLLYQTAELYLTILVTGLLGYTINKSFVILENRLIHWSGK